MKNSWDKKAAFIILITIVLFVFRMLAQLIELVIDIPFVPDFEHWHSGTVPYWRLLMAQIIILIFMIFAYKKFNSIQVKYSKLRGKIYLIWGFVYLSAMMTRHVLGLTIYSESEWFTSFLSIYFHYILAIFLITIGVAHFKGAKKMLVSDKS